ncbi:MAG: NAD(P)H-dependent oxidoreductase [Synergistaceae bacterium]|jgi:chromate reductase|nr:NAD(P)H-dependent oxidoreductase [Synergistaceae bacterium]
MKIGIIVGSLRRESFSRKIAENVARLLPDGVTVEYIGIDLPMYNQDLDDDGTPPQSWTEFREAVKGCNAYLFVTPEYNRTIPPVIKNVLDIGSRPYGKNVWGGKKGAVISVSPGTIGGFGANHALRQAVVFLDITMLQQPEMYIGGVTKLLDKDGNVIESTKAFLRKFVTTFMEFTGGQKEE